MSKRHKISRGKSRRMFGRSAGSTNSRNVAPPPMRGGIRL
jgi:hypothetical protein